MELFRQYMHLLALALLLGPGYARLTPHQKAYRQKHEVVALGKGHVKGPPLEGRSPRIFPRPIAARSPLAMITPSPGAVPVTVTKESQIVTSYIPQFTLCELPPIAEVPVSPPPLSASVSGPFQNFSVSIPTGTGTCTTIYSPTRTMVCASTLTALGKQYTVTNCNQMITFSTQYGYTLESPLPTSAGNLSTNSTASITAGPSIETLTTYYLAPWQQLTAGRAPSEVDLKVCQTFPNGTIECIEQYQVWSTSLVTQTATSVTSINISTTIHGSSQLIIETFVANITEHLTTVSMSTTMKLEYQTEFTTTSSANRSSATAVPVSTAPGVTETFTVEQASSRGSTGSGFLPAGTGALASTGVQDVTSTSTLHITSTIFAGTATVTAQSQTTSS